MIPDFDSYLKDFKDILTFLSKKYRWFDYISPRRSMCNTEMFFITSYIRSIKPELVFESGVWWGRSTIIMAEILKRFLANSRLMSVSSSHKKSLDSFKDEYDNLDIVFGRGEDWSARPKKTSAILVIDGPKFKNWNVAAHLYERAMRNLRINVIFQHDIARDWGHFETFYQRHMSKDYSIDKLPKEFIDRYAKLDRGIEIPVIQNLGMIIKK